MNNEKSKKYKEKDMESEIRSMQPGYSPKSPLPEDQAKIKKRMEKTKEQLENLKKSIIKRYPFTIAIGILPPQASEKIEDEEDLTEEERKQKPIHLMIIIPEEKFKDINKIKAEIIKDVKDMKPRLWVHIKTPVDIWNYCFDSKYDIVDAIAMSFPLYDKGLLGALRVASIHKSLVLRKFEKYVVSYVIAGSLVRGESIKTSDVDVYIIIDDTDVKRMTRLELKEKLRAIIYSYVAEASELAGVKNKLSPQIYILTDFWESVKDAHPVIFTFIRDGVPLYDRGAFMPWKLLLKMGKIKPSPEAIDMFMSMGDKTKEIVKRRMLDLVVGDIYWGVITPSQALLMLYGLPPPNTRETVKEMKHIFVDKEKMLEKKYINILDEIAIKYYKGYEHGKIKEVKGEEIDKLMKSAEEYMKRLKELRKQIEKRAQEKTINHIYDDVFELLKEIFGKKSEEMLINNFEKEFIKKGKLPRKFLGILKDIMKAKKDFKKGKLARHEIENARKNAAALTSHLIEYNQRCDLVSLEKGRLRLKYKEKEKRQDQIAELVLTDSGAFLIEKGNIKKVVGGLKDSSLEEFNKAIEKQKGKAKVKTHSEIFEVLRKELGDFEIVL